MSSPGKLVQPSTSTETADGQRASSSGVSEAIGLNEASSETAGTNEMSKADIPGRSTKGSKAVSEEPAKESSDAGTITDSAIKRFAALIKSGKAKNVVILTGAGISTSAGIPDFRSPSTGLYANLARLNLPFPEAVFELDYFKRNPKPFWTLAKELYPGKHLPTPTHYFFLLLARHNVLRRVFTQNIDTLETLAGLDPSHVVEAHGSFASAHCLTCRKAASTEHVLKSGVRKGETVRCGEKGCSGLVKPDIVFFGEGLPDRFFKSLEDLTICDLLIVIGTSLQVHPFASLPNYVQPHVPRLLINREPVGPFSHLASSSSPRNRSLSAMLASLSTDDKEELGRDRFWEGDADDGVRRLAEELGWGEELEAMIEEGTERLKKEWGVKLAEGEDEALDKAERVSEKVEVALGGAVEPDNRKSDTS